MNEVNKHIKEFQKHFEYLDDYVKFNYDIDKDNINYTSIDIDMRKEFDDVCNNYREYLKKCDIDKLLNYNVDKYIHGIGCIVTKSNFLRYITVRLALDKNNPSYEEIRYVTKIANNIIGTYEPYDVTDIDVNCFFLTNIHKKYPGRAASLVALCGDEFFFPNVTRNPTSISNSLISAYINIHISNKYNLEFYKNLNRSIETIYPLFGYEIDYI